MESENNMHESLYFLHWNDSMSENNKFDSTDPRFPWGLSLV